MSEVTIFTKEELIDALRFEYGEPDIRESIFQSADQIVSAIKHILAICEKKYSVAPNETRRLFWEAEIIKRKRRLLLWQTVQDYLDAQEKPAVGMIYQPVFTAYVSDYWPKRTSAENFEWLLHRFLNCDVCYEILWYWQREQRIALSAGLAECFALLEEYQQHTNRLWLKWQMEE